MKRSILVGSLILLTVTNASAGSGVPTSNHASMIASPAGTGASVRAPRPGDGTAPYVDPTTPDALETASGLAKGVEGATNLVEGVLEHGAKMGPGEADELLNGARNLNKVGKVVGPVGDAITIGEIMRSHKDRGGAAAADEAAGAAIDKALCAAGPAACAAGIVGTEIGRAIDQTRLPGDPEGRTVEEGVTDGYYNRWQGIKYWLNPEEDPTSEEFEQKWKKKADENKRKWLEAQVRDEADQKARAPEQIYPVPENDDTKSAQDYQIPASCGEDRTGWILGWKDRNYDVSDEELLRGMSTLQKCASDMEVNLQ